jgi:hypothetical protein
MILPREVNGLNFKKEKRTQLELLKKILMARTI